MSEFLVSWKGESLRHFIDKNLSAAALEKVQKKETTVELEVGPEFLEGFASLNEDNTLKLLTALEASPIDCLRFDVRKLKIDVERHRGRDKVEKALEHFDRLYQCLGAIPTLKLVSFELGGAVEPKISLTRLLSQFSAVTQTAIYHGGRGSKVPKKLVQDLVEGLRKHGLMEGIVLQLKSHDIPEVLPVLQHLPALKRVVIQSVMTEISHINAIVDLLARPSPIDVVFTKFFAAANEEMYKIFCDGIMDARVKSLVFDECTLGVHDYLPFARALTRSQLQRIRFRSVQEDSKEMREDPRRDLPRSHLAVHLVAFLNELTLGLPTMPQLKQIDFRIFPYYKNFDEECQVALLAAAAQCPHLQYMTLVLERVTPAIDQALAACVRTNPKLEGIDITIQPNEQFECKEIYQAIPKNYTLKHIRFDTLGDEETVPWDVDIKQNLDTYLSLNCAGRGDWDKDPTNAAVVVSVLEEVTDDLDCIFILLRESVFIFGSTALS